MGPLQLEGPWVSLCLHTDTERGARAWVVPHRHPSRRLITERHSAVTASTPSAQNGLHNTAPTREIWMAPQPRAALEAGRAPRRAQRRRVWGPEANTPRRHPQPWTAGLLEADAHEPVLTEEQESADGRQRSQAALRRSATEPRAGGENRSHHENTPCPSEGANSEAKT